jgi:hypothetical protein
MPAAAMRALDLITNTQRRVVYAAIMCKPWDSGGQRSVPQSPNRMVEFASCPTPLSNFVSPITVRTAVLPAAWCSNKLSKETTF